MSNTICTQRSFYLIQCVQIPFVSILSPYNLFLIYRYVQYNFYGEALIADKNKEVVVKRGSDLDSQRW